MGRIERDKDGNIAVVIESESDAAQLRATIMASNGADKVPAKAIHWMKVGDSPSPSVFRERSS